MNTTTYFVLSEVIKREISTPVLYKDFCSAVAELHIRMAQAFGYTESEIDEMLNDIESDYENGISVDYRNQCATAWGELYGSHQVINWDISSVEI